jgi:hypothetical protein
VITCDIIRDNVWYKYPQGQYLGHVDTTTKTHSTMACTEICNPWQYLPWDNLVLTRINKYTLFFTTLSPPPTLSYQFQHCILVIPFYQKFFFCGAHRIHRGHAGSLAHEMVWNYSIYMHIDFDKGCRKKNCQLLPNTRLSVRKILGKILGREPRNCPTFMELPPPPPPPPKLFLSYTLSNNILDDFPVGFSIYWRNWS